LHITFEALDMLSGRRERESDADLCKERDKILEDRFCIGMYTLNTMTMTGEGLCNVGHASLEDGGGSLVGRPDNAKEGGNFINNVDALRASTCRRGWELREVDRESMSDGGRWHMLRGGHGGLPMLASEALRAGATDLAIAHDVRGAE
jgi:hypothetical protein